jgi:FkbM family methyltransferase
MPERAWESVRHLGHAARPHFLFRPTQLLARLRAELEADVPERRFVLPWGAEITARTLNPDDPLGIHLRRRGILDPLVCETLLRLTDPGETVLDVGANVGHMTSLLAYAVGEHGRVIAFEPHPETFERLTRNTAGWSGWARIETRQIGLSDTDGVANLATDVYDINQGSPSLEPLSQRRGRLDEHSVRVQRLDSALEDGATIGVMKIDIEGHELHALRGASAMLSAGRIRDIVFEERDEPPTPVTNLFEAHGYTVMRLGERLRGPILGPLSARDVRSRDIPSLLATRAPQRAVELMGVRGWAIFGAGPAGRIERARREATPGS